MLVYVVEDQSAMTYDSRLFKDLLSSDLTTDLSSLAISDDVESRKYSDVLFTEDVTLLMRAVKLCLVVSEQKYNPIQFPDHETALTNTWEALFGV